MYGVAMRAYADLWIDCVLNRCISFVALAAAAGGGGGGGVDVCIYDSELMCGTLDKSTLGSGSKNNVFHVLMRDFGPDIAANRMSRLARLCARWIGNQGFSIGVSDVTPSHVLEESKRALIAHHYAKCDGFIAEFKAGKLVPQPGCNEEQTLEVCMHAHTHTHCRCQCHNRLIVCSSMHVCIGNDSQRIVRDSFGSWKRMPRPTAPAERTVDHGSMRQQR
jgi:hypothetical protein